MRMRTARSTGGARWREQRSSRMLLAQLSLKPLMRDNNVYVNSCEHAGDRGPSQVVHFQMNVPDLPGPSADADRRLQPVPLRSNFNRMKSKG